MNKRRRKRIVFAAIAVFLCALFIPLIVKLSESDPSKVPSEADNTETVIHSSTSDANITPEPDDERISVLCRVIDGASDGNLLLAGQGDSAGVYFLNINDYTLTAKSPAFEQLENGMLLSVTCSGIMETYPAQFNNIHEIFVQVSGMDNLCELYLNVLNDLWDVDSGLNSDITELGVDLSSTRLNSSEQAAVAWAFGAQHGLEGMQGTWQDFTEMGYIDDEFLYWENGCLFSISESETGGGNGTNTLTFNAQKWRSGDGAYFFLDCTATRSATGIWTDYEIGGHAIS